MSGATPKVAVVTGGGSGIGRASAVKLSSLGYALVITDRCYTKLGEAKRQCELAGSPSVVEVYADLRHDEDVERIVNETATNFDGRIHVLVNSAGILMRGNFQDSHIDDFDKCNTVNVKTLLRMTKAALPQLIAAKGSVINLSSMNGKRAVPAVTYYCMAKAAVDQFSKCLALELAPQGVRVNAIQCVAFARRAVSKDGAFSPGVVRTNLHRSAGMNEEDYAQFLAAAATAHPLGRVGEAEEVADAVAFLAGEQSAFVTGHLLRVDGGRSAVTPAPPSRSAK